MLLLFCCCCLSRGVFVVCFVVVCLLLLAFVVHAFRIVVQCWCCFVCASCSVLLWLDIENTLARSQQSAKKVRRIKSTPKRIPPKRMKSTSRTRINTLLRSNLLILFLLFLFAWFFGVLLLLCCSCCLSRGVFLFALLLFVCCWLLWLMFFGMWFCAGAALCVLRVLYWSGWILRTPWREASDPPRRSEESKTPPQRTPPKQKNKKDPYRKHKSTLSCDRTC